MLIRQNTVYSYGVFIDERAYSLATIGNRRSNNIDYLYIHVEQILNPLLRLVSFLFFSLSMTPLKRQIQLNVQLQHTDPDRPPYEVDR